MESSSKVIGLDIKSAFSGIGVVERDKRDLLVYMFWKTGRFFNREIGNLFGLTCSAVSQRVKTMNSRLPVEKDLRSQYVVLKSQFKV